MKRWLWVGMAVGLVLTLVFGIVYLLTNHRNLISPLGQQIVPKPLDKYTYESLRQRKYQPSSIQIDHLLKSGAGYTSWVIYFKSDGKQVSGVLNLPAKISTTSAYFDNPTVIMVHGSASQQEYYPGFGTQPVATVLAQNGYVTIAPDLLGYATSDQPSSDPFENRFETYTTVLNLLATVGNSGKRFIWAHSNGGQIALSVLEISGVNYPTALWAPVSKHFPYDILFYTDSYDDQGKWLRHALAQFEDNYNVDKYDLALYFDWINAPILLQQGSADPWVPQSWSDQFYKIMTDKKKTITYKVYSGADHNLQPKWNQAVSDLLQFYSHAN